jgi:hypothetical protein
MLFFWYRYFFGQSTDQVLSKKLFKLTWDYKSLGQKAEEFNLRCVRHHQKIPSAVEYSSYFFPVYNSVPLFLVGSLPLTLYHVVITRKAIYL